MISLSRRRLILGAASVSALGLGGWYYYAGRPPVSKSQLLSSVIDTIVPRDDTAGALDLHLDKQMEKRLEQQPKRKEQFVRLLDRINEAALREYRREFPRLSQSDREELLTAILKSDNTSPGYVTMHRLRSTVLMWYYQSAEAHSALGYTHPNRYPAYPGAPKHGSRWTLTH